jgi:NAD(P)-dependent dehydrogenase (short-subunit alcohol dehydrogenase family)
VIAAQGAGVSQDAGGIDTTLPATFTALLTIPFAITELVPPELFPKLSAELPISVIPANVPASVWLSFPTVTASEVMPPPAAVAWSPNAVERGRALRRGPDRDVGRPRLRTCRGGSGRKSEPLLGAAAVRTIVVMEKVVVITGAGSGIGRATARFLLHAGHRVVLAGRRPEALIESAENHPNARSVPTDVANADSVKALFADTVSKYGRVDVLFNNAGVFGPSASVEQIDDDQWHDTWRTNVDGAVFCAREAVRVMSGQLPRGGRIINNGSLSAHRPRPHSLAYTVTKHAISGLTASMLLDLRDIDICVTQIDIGNAATVMTTSIGTETMQASGDLSAEPTFDAKQVARSVAYLVDMPLEVSVPSLTVMARAMPYFGRG